MSLPHWCQRSSQYGLRQCRWLLVNIFLCEVKSSKVMLMYPPFGNLTLTHPYFAQDIILIFLIHGNINSFIDSYLLYTKSLKIFHHILISLCSGKGDREWTANGYFNAVHKPSCRQKSESCSNIQRQTSGKTVQVNSRTNPEKNGMEWK